MTNKIQYCFVLEKMLCREYKKKSNHLRITVSFKIVI